MRLEGNLDLNKGGNSIGNGIFGFKYKILFLLILLKDNKLL